MQAETESGLYLEEVSLRAGAAPFSHIFRAGEIAVVMGGNGAGKTDLCRFVAGLSSTISSGRITLHGRAMEDVPTRQRSIGYVYQAFVNYPNMTVAQNIASPLRARKQLSAQDIQDRVVELAEKLRIEALLKRYPHELSGGQQQRLAIARALARDAEVLLLDEPLVNLDFKLREALVLELRELLSDSQTVVIYTSSDQSDAYTLADELLLLDEGELLQSGAPMALYKQPVSAEAMRIMADPQINTWREGGQLCAVRPEHLRVLEGNEEAALEFEMLVEGIETAGSHSWIFGQCQGDTWAISRLGIFAATAGQKLRVGTAKDDVVRFDV